MAGAKSGESKSSKRRISATEKQRQALELRKAGVPFRDIADQLGYRGPSGAYKAVMCALEKTLQEPADDLRRLELERLDAITLEVYRAARQGQLGAIDRLIRIMERRSKLLGLDLPVQLELSGPGGGAIPIKEIVIARPERNDDDNEEQQ